MTLFGLINCCQNFEGPFEGTAIRATQSHVSEGPKYDFYFPLQLCLMADGDVHFFKLLPEKKGDPCYVVIVFR